jgi:hypothetical protein
MPIEFGGSGKSIKDIEGGWIEKIKLK